MSWVERLTDTCPHVIAYAATAWGMVVLWQIGRALWEVIVP